MENKIIPMYPNGVPHREQPVAQAKKNLNRDIAVIRDELADLMQ
jgi:hypothetical protein